MLRTLEARIRNHFEVGVRVRGFQSSYTIYTVVEYLTVAHFKPVTTVTARSLANKRNTFSIWEIPRQFAGHFKRSPQAYQHNTKPHRTVRLTHSRAFAGKCHCLWPNIVNNQANDRIAKPTNKLFHKCARGIHPSAPTIQNPTSLKRIRTFVYRKNANTRYILFTHEDIASLLWYCGCAQCFSRWVVQFVPSSCIPLNCTSRCKTFPLFFLLGITYIYIQWDRAVWCCLMHFPCKSRRSTWSARTTYAHLGHVMFIKWQPNNTHTHWHTRSLSHQNTARKRDRNRSHSMHSAPRSLHFRCTSYPVLFLLLMDAKCI